MRTVVEDGVETVVPDAIPDAISLVKKCHDLKYKKASRKEAQQIEYIIYALSKNAEEGVHYTTIYENVSSWVKSSLREKGYRVAKVKKGWCRRALVPWLWLSVPTVFIGGMLVAIYVYYILFLPCFLLSIACGFFATTYTYEKDSTCRNRHCKRCGKHVYKVWF